MAQHIYTPEDDNSDDGFDALYFKSCIACDSSPVVRVIDMCGPCTFGEAAMVDGAWVDE